MSDVQVFILMAAIYFAPHIDKKWGYVLGWIAFLLAIVRLFI